MAHSAVRKAGVPISESILARSAATPRARWGRGLTCADPAGAHAIATAHVIAAVQRRNARILPRCVASISSTGRRQSVVLSYGYGYNSRAGAQRDLDTIENEMRKILARWNELSVGKLRYVD